MASYISLRCIIFLTFLKLVEKTKSAYQEMYNDKLKKYIDKSNENTLEIINLVESWDSTDINKKIEMIRKNFISKLREDSKLNRNILELEVDGVKSNIINLLDFVKKFVDNIIKNSSAVGIECEVKTIFNTLREKYDYVQKCDVLKASKIVAHGYDDFGFNNKSNFEKAEENIRRNNSFIDFNRTGKNFNLFKNNNPDKENEKFSVFPEEDGSNKNKKDRSANNDHKAENNIHTPEAADFNNNNAFNFLHNTCTHI